MPEDPCYLPLQVGSALAEDIGIQRDDTGDNISSGNHFYCELTGLYWMWKNVRADYKGMVHYRRYFSTQNHLKNLFCSDKYKAIAGSGDYEKLLEKTDMILPVQRHYLIESLYSHYAHTHYADQLDQTRSIIAEHCPDYLESYDAVVNRTWGYMFNMMILRRDLLDAYCRWLFDILFTLRERMSGVELDAFQARFYGRVSEIIFNVWLDHQLRSGALAPEQLREIPCIHMEPVNWWKKGTAFLKAKFFHQRYDSSF
jgi:hypothetical protein